MLKCVACNTFYQRNSNTDIHFHTIPKDPQRRDLWLKILKLNDCYNWYRVCSKHFSPNDYKRGYKRWLLQTAVPKLDNIVHSSNNVDNTPDNINNASNNVDNTQDNINNAPDDIYNAPNNTDYAPSSSTEPQISELVYTNNINKIEQSLESSEKSTENPTTINFSSPRRSSRKIKPVTTDDFVTYQNKSLSQYNNNKIIPPTIQFNTPKQKYTKKGKFRGNRCSVKNCQNKQSQSISFFGYPLFNKSLRQIWIQNCGIQDIANANDIKVNTYLKVCGCHFEDTMFLNPLKRNRLKRNAIPTLFYDNDLSNTSLAVGSLNENFQMMEDTSNNDMSNNDDMESRASKELQSMAIMNEPSTSLFNESMNDILNTHGTRISHNIRDSNCCVPDCYNGVDFNKIMNNSGDSNSIFLHTPPTNEVIRDWSHALRVPLTLDSLVCERHFKPDDIVCLKSFTENGIIEKRSLVSGAMPIIIEPKKGVLKRRIVNKANNNLSVKKPRIHLVEDSQIIIKHTDLPECEDTEPVDIVPTTSTDNSMSNNAKSSFKQLLPKILSNKSLSITLQPNFNNGIHITEREYNKVDEPTVVLLPSTNIKYKPNYDEDDDGNVHSITPTNESIISDSLQSSLRQIRSKTSAISSHSVSITLESSNKQNAQISTIESTKDNHTDVLKSNTEPTDILSTISANCSLTNSSRSSIEELLSKTLSNNSLSITLEPNTSKKSKILSDSASTNVINSTIAISKSAELTDDTIPTILITDDDDDSISESDYSQSSFEKLPPKTSANGSLTMTLNKQKKQSKQISEIECNEVINPTVILKPTLKQNTEHIDILPLTSVGSTLPSSLKKILSKNTANNSLSITLKPNHDNVATTSSNGYMSKTVQSNSKHSEKEYATTFNVSSNSKTPNSREINTHCSICNTHFFHIDKMCSKEKEEIKFNNALSIIKVAKHILFPNFLWKCLYNIGLKKILFIQRDCMKGLPVKKIKFFSGLIPNININGKRYEYNIAINTKQELEDLLEKIDDIDICFGLDGYTHDQCIGYYDNPSGENEACERCNSLLQDGYLSRMDTMLKNKLLKIKNLENRIAEKEVRVLQARELFKNNKREDVKKVLTAIEPFSFFRSVKPPDYI